MRHEPRVVAGLLAAAATSTVTIPLTHLFETSPWLPPALVGILVVTGSGILLRALTARSGVIVALQTLVAALYLLLTQLGETTRYLVLPTGRTITTFVDHVVAAQETITKYAAPAPAEPGIVVLLVVIVVVVALAVDLSSASATSPSVAGLPLLSLFLVSAANSNGELHPGWFLTGAGLWLAMVVHQADVDLRGWATSIPLMAHGDGEDLAARSHRWQAARVGGLALAVAVLLSTALPHMPTRYVLDGLARGGAGAGTGTGIRLSTELDLKRSLESQSQVPVLRYTTDDPTPQPLRVAVVEEFQDGFGRMRARALEPRQGFVPNDPLASLPESIEREERRLVVENNGIAAPQLPMPWLTESADLGEIPWSIGRDGTARVQRTPGSYAVTYTELDLEDEDFLAGGNPADPVDTTSGRDQYLTLDPGSAAEITELADSLVEPGDSPIREAQAIQRHLRGTDFSYSLDLPPIPDGTDPIVAFLESKVGYCQQYAATMTLLARARGIPARVVVGFLPGTLSNGQERIVRAADAHAWPELYFEGVGWVRFEPTPGQRAASVPGYTIDTSGNGIGPEETTSTSETTSSTSQAEQTDDETEQAQAGPVVDEGTPAWVWWLVALAVALALLSIMPLSAVVARRRARRTARDDAARVEREWRELVSQLADLGIRAPVGATPRQTGRWLGRRMHLEPEMQGRLDHVVSTLERARYAPPGGELPDVSREVGAVVDRVRSTRQRSAQLRSLLWPRDGVDAWRAVWRSLVTRLRPGGQSR